MLHDRATKNSVINQVLSNANGIGESKLEAQRSSGIKGQNGQAVSSKAHSIASMKNLRTVTTQFTNFVNDNYTGKPLKNMDKDSAREWINKKIEEGTSLPTINTYISDLGKIADNLKQLGQDGLARADIHDLRRELIREHGTLQSDKIDRTNNDPQAIVQKMNDDTPFGLSASLQFEAGLRVDDAITIDKLHLKEDNTIHVIGSKNGLSYTTAPISENLAEKLLSHQEAGYKAGYTEYKDSMKEVVISLGQEWRGTHSLRYDYANTEHEKNLIEGMTPTESKYKISSEMGHTRPDITEHYLKDN